MQQRALVQISGFQGKRYLHEICPALHDELVQMNEHITKDMGIDFVVKFSEKGILVNPTNRTQLKQILVTHPKFIDQVKLAVAEESQRPLRLWDNFEQQLKTGSDILSRRRDVARSTRPMFDMDETMFYHVVETLQEKEKEIQRKLGTCLPGKLDQGRIDEMKIIKILTNANKLLDRVAEGVRKLVNDAEQLLYDCFKMKYCADNTMLNVFEAKLEAAVRGEGDISPDALAAAIIHTANTKPDELFEGFKQFKLEWSAIDPQEYANKPTQKMEKLFSRFEELWDGIAEAGDYHADAFDLSGISAAQTLTIARQRARLLDTSINLQPILEIFRLITQHVANTAQVMPDTSSEVRVVPKREWVKVKPEQVEKVWTTWKSYVQASKSLKKHKDKHGSVKTGRVTLINSFQTAQGQWQKVKKDTNHSAHLENEEFLEMVMKDAPQELVASREYTEYTEQGQDDIEIMWGEDDYYVL